MPDDPHSYSQPDQRPVRHVDWQVEVDFARRVLRGRARLHLGDGTGPVDLDTSELALHAVRDADGAEVGFELGEADPVLGRRLRLWPGANVRVVDIAYETTRAGRALQWLDPAQTADGTHPYVFSQCQTIHARSLLPIPDSPSRRFSYTAEVVVPDGFTAVMAARLDAVEHLGPDGGRRYRFEQTRPVPAYLIALAVGALTGRNLSPRCRVWAESSVIEAAAWEFAEVETLLAAAEQVMGPFPWARADLLVMPPSYPYGGMENPQLMFLTPTLIAGDRSLVNVLCHEIVHHWTGDMVTCASLEHFWINEGFTVFGERKAIAIVDGPEVAELQAAVGRANLDDDLRYLADQPELTRLHLDLRGRDPDVASSWVALEKGYLFLRAIEAQVGAERFAEFLRDYLQAHAFASVTGEQFVDYARDHLDADLDWDTWLHGVGLPADAPATDSPILQAIRRIGDDLPPEQTVRGWGADHWQAYLAGLSVPANLGLLTALDRTYRLTGSGNHDILSQWLLIGLRSGYAPAVPATIDLVGRMGRLKDLKTLYVALAERPGTHRLALETFAANRERYHPIAVTVVAERLDRVG